MSYEVTYLSNIEDRLCDILEEMRAWRLEAKTAPQASVADVDAMRCTKAERELIEAMLTYDVEDTPSIVRVANATEAVMAERRAKESKS